MKRILMKVFTVIMILSIGTTSVFAAGRGRRRNFVDTDKNGVCDFAYIDAGRDGVCDFAEESHRYIDVNLDGICDNCVCQNKHGTYFTDADGDGICDNCLGQKTGRDCGFRGGCNR